MTKTSISIVKGKGSMNHNNREFFTENIDQSKTPNNITYKQESLEDAYEHCFGQAIAEYNAKQKRADRRINGVKGYLKQIENSKNGEKLFYENVVQVGNMYDSHVGTKQGELCKTILDDYMRDFQERNPNLYVFNAVLHLDEQTPHLHIDYIPLAHGYRQGLQVRNSLDRAFKEQGIEGKSNKYENRTIAWQEREKNYIEQLMRTRGLERAEDKGLDREHLTVEQYKAVAERVQNELEQMPSQIESNPTLLNKSKVTVKKEDLNQLEQRAKLSQVHENTIKQLLAEVKKNAQETSQINSNTKKTANHVESLRQRYEFLYESQKTLNIDYENLFMDYLKQKDTIKSLQAENTLLTSQIDDLSDSMDEAVQMATKPLKTQIRALQTRTEEIVELYEQITNEFANNLETLENTLQLIPKLVGAVRALKYGEYGDNRFKANLIDVQADLVDAIYYITVDYARSIDRPDIVEKIESQICVADELIDEICNMNYRNLGIEK